MKLVEILASVVSEWHDRTERLHQDGDGRIYATCRKMPKFHKEWNEWDVSGHEVIMNVEDPIYGDCLDLADDYKTSVVTRAQWKSERDRQKGGEWKRHRGNSQPVDEGTWVEVKLRCGDIQQGLANAFLWRHFDCDVAANIMKYRIISQPQAEEVEVKDTTIGTLVYKVEIDSSAATQAIDELAAKWDQVDGPLLWRDRIVELEAHAEDIQREISGLFAKLNAEGFQLIRQYPSLTNILPASLPFAEWKKGDIVTSKVDYNL